MQNKSKTSFPPDWNPDSPENFNSWCRHIRTLLHSDGDIHRLAQVDLGRSFDKLKQSINPKNHGYDN